MRAGGLRPTWLVCIAALAGCAAQDPLARQPTIWGQPQAEIRCGLKARAYVSRHSVHHLDAIVSVQNVSNHPVRVVRLDVWRREAATSDVLLQHPIAGAPLLYFAVKAPLFSPELLQWSHSVVHPGEIKPVIWPAEVVTLQPGEIQSVSDRLILIWMGEGAWPRVDVQYHFDDARPFVAGVDAGGVASARLPIQLK